MIAHRLSVTKPDRYCLPFKSHHNFFLTPDGPFGPARFCMVFINNDHLWPSIPN
jgi:hypothetical protein